MSALHSALDLDNSPRLDDGEWPPRAAHDPAAMLRQLQWMAEPAAIEYGDALIEIAYGTPGAGITRARLFGLDELNEAVAFGGARNAEGSNVYVGAALKVPDAPRDRRCSGEHFYVGTAVPCDIDSGHDAAAARLGGLASAGLVVTTGTHPEIRAQYWLRLTTPCDVAEDFGHAFDAVVGHIGADPNVKDFARLMRWGGTVSYPSPAKATRGYVIEATTACVNAAAQPVAIEALHALAPLARPGLKFDASGRPRGTGVETGPDGRIENGRETHFRNLLLRHVREHQAKHGADPDEAELWELAWADFSAAAVNNDDGRWTTGEGLKMLAARVRTTLSRLRDGRLAGAGLYSIDTGIAQERAEQVARARDARRRAYATPAAAEELIGATAAPEFDAVAFGGEVPPPRPWAYGKLLLLRATTALAAPPGTGKTTFAIQLGIAFCLGLGLGPYTPRQTGPVWIWNNEDDRDELNRRTLAACALMDVSPGRLAGRLYLNTGAERALIVGIQDKKTGRLIATPDVARVVEVIKARGIKLLMVDPFAETFEADENSNDMMKRVAGLYRQIAQQGDCSVMLVLHTPKSADADKSAGDLGAIRGGGAIGGVVRVALTMFEMSERDAETVGVPKESRHLYVRVDDAKANMSLKSGEATWWRKEAIVLDNASEDAPADHVGVLDYVTFTTKAKQAEDTATQQLDRLCAELVRVCEANGHVSSEASSALAAICSALDPVRLGFAARTAADRVIGQIAPSLDFDGRRIVVASIPRGGQTVRRVHVERLSDAAEAA